MFAKQASGVTELERTLSERLNINTVCIAQGNADDDARVVGDIGRIAASRLRGMLHNGSTLAVSGGSTVARIAEALTPGVPMHVMVVPARGGTGTSITSQANTSAAMIAEKLGGHHRLLYIPNRLDSTVLAEMLKVP